MAFRVAIEGFPFGKQGLFQRLDDENDLLFRVLSSVAGKPVVISSVRDADLVIVYPYIQWSRIFKLRARTFTALYSRGLIGGSELLRRVIGLQKRRVLVVSPENLDKSYWEQFGWMVRLSDIPRLTFWPETLDPKGCRLPYWYNYVEWPEFPRPKYCYKRFGELYSLQRLMEPIQPNNRFGRAICISSHQQFPRDAIVARIRERIPVDFFGAAGARLIGPKVEIMRRYKYCLCPENSVGYGYDTEKIPEAWIAGCIPVGTFEQPYSDFNRNVLIGDEFDSTFPMEEPLLQCRPNLRKVVQYLGEVVAA